jgi:hypothetical protein
MPYAAAGDEEDVGGGTIVIASEAKQSSIHVNHWIASSLSLLAMTALTSPSQRG